jgi:hypothetical protein
MNFNWIVNRFRGPVVVSILLIREHLPFCSPSFTISACETGLVGLEARRHGLFSWAGFVSEAFAFLFIPLTFAYCVLADSPHGRDNKQQAPANSDVSLKRKAPSEPKSMAYFWRYRLVYRVQLIRPSESE